MRIEECTRSCYPTLCILTITTSGARFDLRCTSNYQQNNNRFQRQIPILFNQMPRCHASYLYSFPHITVPCHTLILTPNSFSASLGAPCRHSHWLLHFMMQSQTQSASTGIAIHSRLFRCRFLVAVLHLFTNHTVLQRLCRSRAFQSLV